MIDYSRQKIFDMQSIGSAKITIVGTGVLGDYLGMYMAGLGIKNLKIIGKEAEQLEQKLLKINPELGIKTRNTTDEISLGKPDVLIEATNNKNSKEFCKNHARKNNTPLINIASEENNASVQIENLQNDFSFYEGKKQGNFTSGIIAAIALDEARKIIMPMQDDQKLKRRIDFSMHKAARFNSGIEQKTNQDSIHGMRTLIVGAGGIGTHLAYNLALMGIGEMDLIDGDKIENHNLNRQTLYYDRVGRNKAETLAERLSEITTSKIGALPYYLKHESQIRKKYDIIFSCVDNWEWRTRLSRYAKRNKIAMINGAVTTFSAKTEFSNCLECKYERNGIREDGNRGGCNSLESNVVMQNAFAGALMASETKAIAMPSRYSNLTGKEVRYNTKNSDERKIIIINSNCTCRR